MKSGIDDLNEKDERNIKKLEKEIISLGQESMGKQGEELRNYEQSIKIREDEIKYLKK